MTRIWVVLLTAALMAPLMTVPAATRTQLLLASTGSDGVAATAATAQPALSADGSHTAFVTPVTLTVSASVPQTVAENSGEADRVYVHDRHTGTTELLSDAGAGDATAPTIDGDGGLVAYQLTARESQIDVVATAARTVTQVTGNAGDPRYQRLGSCPFFGIDCGPTLSADGGTLVYPAQLSPVSPSFTLSGQQEGSAPGNVIDLVNNDDSFNGGFTGGEPGGDPQAGFVLRNTGTTTIDLTGSPTVTGPFQLISFACGTDVSTDSLSTTDLGPPFATVQPGQACFGVVEFLANENCPSSAPITVESGDLTTNATTPAGQTNFELVGACAANFGGTTTTVPVPPAASGCAPGPAGLTAQPAPVAIGDNQGTALVDVGQQEVGRPILETTQVTGFGTVDFTAPDCSLQLVVPPDTPNACQQGEVLDEQTTGCTAYLLVAPQAVATRAGLLTVTRGPGNVRSTYVAVTGRRGVIVARHGPAFAQGTVISAAVPGAADPSVSANGGVVAYATDNGVWRTDTGLVAANGSEPAISGDADSTAYVADGQVEITNATTGVTRTVAAGQHPAISGDGGTVAYETPNDLIVVDPGAGNTETIAGSTPSLDAHGRVLALVSPNQLLPAAPPNVVSTYTFERLDTITANPAQVGYGRLTAGLPGQTRTVTVTNGGPGPTVVTGVGITGGYVLIANGCQGFVLHGNQSCELVVLLIPTTTGTPAGTLTITTSDDGDPTETTTIPLSATVVAPTVPTMNVRPTVAYGGQVIRATGAAFPVGTRLTLSWDRGLGTTTVMTDAGGGFTADVVIFPDDQLGARHLVATGPGGNTLATLPFLVEANPKEPPFHK